jgi:hypothetical protein
MLQVSFRTCATAALMSLVAGMAPLPAQQSRAQVVERQQAPAPAPQILIQDQDASETRERFEEMLKKMPPAIGRVLRLDPSLMNNEAYLATYPTLAAFIKQHPEIRNNPGFFFEHVGPYEFWTPSRPPTREDQIIRMWNETIEFFAIGGVMVIIGGVFIWLVRTIVEYRRWSRTSKVQTEVHNKLMDRFTANEDLLAYMQTPVGRRFLESAPMTLDAPPRPVGAPFSRILWSIQAGVVLAAGALGLLFVSGRVIEEVAQVLFAIGVLALAVGVGFVVSAAASFLLSRRLGLFEPPGTPREHSGPTGA